MNIVSRLSRLADNIRTQIREAGNPREWSWDLNGVPGQPTLYLENVEIFMHAKQADRYFSERGSVGWEDRGDYKGWNDYGPFGILLSTDDGSFELGARGELKPTHAQEASHHPFRSFEVAVAAVAAALEARTQLLG